MQIQPLTIEIRKAATNQSGGNPSKSNILLFWSDGRFSSNETPRFPACKSQITVVSIIPNGPGFRANLVQTLVDLAIQMKKDRLKKEKEPPKPPAEAILVSRIFEAVSKELASEDGALDNLQVILKRLEDNYFVSSKQPLNISGNRNASKPKAQDEDYVPAPEWLVYIEKLNHSWSLKKVDSVKATQLELEHAWQRKTTQFAFEFHRLKPINYILAAKTSNGNVIVTKQDAQAKRYSMLQIIWTDSIS